MSFNSNNTARSELNIGTQESLTKFINSLSEGFELLELIFDKQGNIVDFKFLEVNPAYENKQDSKQLT